MSDKVIRSKTGKYHLGTGSSSRCNGRSGRFATPLSSQFDRASDSSLCSKCFNQGRDTLKFEAEYGAY